MRYVIYLILGLFYLPVNGLSLIGEDRVGVVEVVPPVNDNCSGAITLVPQVFQVNGCGNGVAGTTEGATQSSGATLCFMSSIDDDIWFTFTATSSTQIIRLCEITTTSGVFPSTMGMELYKPCDVSVSTCSGSVVITGGSGNGFSTLNYTNLQINSIYFLRVWTRDATGRVSFNISIFNQALAPTNNECSGATTLTPQNYQDQCNNSILGTTDGATQSSTDCGTTSTDDDIWFSFIAGSMTESLKLCNITLSSGGFPTQMGLNVYTSCSSGYTNCFPNLNINGSSGVGTINATLVSLVIGTTYYLRIWTTGVGGRVSFDINVYNPPINDNCNGAILYSPSINGNCTYTSLSTGGSTKTLTPVPSCTSTGNDDDIWYRFTASASGVHRLLYNTLTAITGSANDLAYDLYTGSCASLTPVIGACDFGFGSGGSGTDFTPSLNSGTIYYLRLWVGGLSNSGTFNLCLEDQSALPVSLTSFNGIAVDKDNLLSWQTVSEVNADSFLIQRSSDEQLTSFETIASIKTKGSPGAITDYNYVDKQPDYLSYYRLKILDLDKSFEYSKIIAVTNPIIKQQHLLVYPNPVKNEANVSFYSNKLELINIIVMDVIGRIVEYKPVEFTQGQVNYKLDTSDYYPGVYFVSLNSASLRNSVIFTKN